MHLTMHTDFSLRILMLLALEPDELHTVDEVSRRYDISRNHLTKVAQTLVKHGFVEAVRGRGGGLMLAKPASKINLGSVVRSTEDSFALVECFNSERNACVVTSACGLRSPLEEALRAFLEVLDGYSLSDLLDNPRRCQRMHRLLNDYAVPG